MCASLFVAADSPAQQLVVPDGNAYRGKKIIAQTYNSGFEDAHDVYNGMGTARDGKVYFVLCSERYDVGAQMYCFDPKTQKITHVGDLTEACGEKGKHTIVQGKSHVNFIEANGKLYFGTHLGYYSSVEGKESMGIPPAGWKAYPGGHLLSYDLRTGQFEDLATAPNHEGVLAFMMDPNRGRLFALTWPSGLFLRYNLATHDLKNFGKQCAEGEDGVGPTYRTVCRSIAVDLDDGSAYFTTSEGTILRYSADTDSVAPVEGEDMRKDYFGLYDPTSPGHMGYNWRQTFWRAKDKMIYGVHGNSGYLFRFDPRVPRLEVLDRITSRLHARAGRQDDLLPDRRADLRGRQTAGGQVQDRDGRSQGARRPARDHLRRREAEIHRPRRGVLPERPAPALRKRHHDRQGRHGVHAPAHHRERKDTVGPG